MIQEISKLSCLFGDASSFQNLDQTRSYFKKFYALKIIVRFILGRIEQQNKRQMMID